MDTLSSSSVKMFYPSLVKRLQAMMVDFLILLSLFSLISLMIGEIGEVAPWVRASIFLGIICLYEPLLVAFTGGTLGHKLFHIRIVSADDSQRNISFIKAVIRILIKSALGWISFLTVTANAQKQAIHDMASGSLVIIR
ncbi:RDD family protein [Catalinimonas niigatensis]|uniref:RDD family protein n=1 Tax=Catalinimonas niigatensis TaxID=1397264 RepID=UPI0026659973|nr:RDD family protein [Catalinimonas niigatensis]WPP49346.1 RDD family protein [Catalinimonas niigatensis]